MASIVYKNNCITIVDITPAKFLRLHPNSFYTTLVLTKKRKVFGWKEHRSRLLYYQQLINFNKLEKIENRVISMQNNINATNHYLLPALKAVANFYDVNFPLEDIFTVILLNWCQRSFRTIIYANCCQWPLKFADPLSAQILKIGGRDLAHIKNSAWSKKRIKLDTLAENVGETILATPSGDILEGTITNVFVLATSPSHDKVLDGVMRSLVIKHCKLLGFQVIEKAANLKCIESWKEVFITNSFRIIQPIEKLIYMENGILHEHKLPNSGLLAKQLHSMFEAIN